MIWTHEGPTHVDPKLRGAEPVGSRKVVRKGLIFLEWKTLEFPWNRMQSTLRGVNAPVYPEVGVRPIGLRVCDGHWRGRTMVHWQVTTRQGHRWGEVVIDPHVGGRLEGHVCAWHRLGMHGTSTKYGCKPEGTTQEYDFRPKLGDR